MYILDRTMTAIRPHVTEISSVDTFNSTIHQLGLRINKHSFISIKQNIVGDHTCLYFWYRCLYITLRNATLRNATLCYAMLCYAMLCYAMPCHAMLCYAMLCYAKLCYAMLCYAISYYATLCYATLWHAMLCYAMLYATDWPSLFISFHTIITLDLPLSGLSRTPILPNAALTLKTLAHISCVLLWRCHLTRF